MSQQEIVNILRKEYPRYVTAEYIIKLLDRSRGNIYRGLKRLQKRDEIQIRIVYGVKKLRRSVTYYRIMDKNVKTA